MVTVVVEVEERWECDCKLLDTVEAIDKHILAQWNMMELKPLVEKPCWGRTLIGSVAWYSVHA